MSTGNSNSNNSSQSIPTGTVMAPLKLEVTHSVDWQSGKLDWPVAGEIISNYNVWPTAAADLGLHTFPTTDMSTAMMTPTSDMAELNWSPAPTTPSCESVLDFKWNTSNTTGDANHQGAALGIWLLNLIGDNHATIESISEMYSKFNEYTTTAATTPSLLVHSSSSPMVSTESLLLDTAAAAAGGGGSVVSGTATSPALNNAEQRMPDSEPLVSVMQRLSVQPESSTGASSPSHLTLEMARAAVMAQFNSSTASPNLTSLESTPLASNIESPIGMMQPFYPLALFPADGNTLPIARPGSPSSIGHIPSSMASMSVQPVGAPVAVALNHPHTHEMPGLRLQPVPIHPTVYQQQQQSASTSMATSLPGSHPLQANVSPFGVSQFTMNMQGISGSLHTGSAASTATSNVSTTVSSVVASGNGTRRDANHRPFVCQECQKRFARPSALRLHMRTHSGERPHACPHPGCGRRFSVQSNLTRHLRLHARNGGFSPRESRRSSSHGTSASSIRESVIPSRHCHTLVPSRMASQSMMDISSSTTTSGAAAAIAAPTSYVEELAAILSQNSFAQ